MEATMVCLDVIIEQEMNALATFEDERQRCPQKSGKQIIDYSPISVVAQHQSLTKIQAFLHESGLVMWHLLKKFGFYFYLDNPKKYGGQCG